MNKSFTLDDVLEAIIVEEEKPSYEAMNRWVSRYPEHKAQLISFFGTWAIQSEQPGETPAVDSQVLASRGVSYALSLLEESAQTLLDRARILKLSEEQLAARTGLDDSVLQKLNRRLISDVPQECMRRLASVLGDPIEFVHRLVLGPPILAQMKYKSSKRPVVTQEDFLTAVRSSSLPASLREEWTNILAAEKCEARSA